MNRLLLFFFSLFLICPVVALAQHGNEAAAASSGFAPAEARQFDFLLGQWEIEVRPKVSSLVAMIHGAPRLVGTWTASKTADDLGVKDEMHIMDASGNPISLSRALRTYSKTDGRWKVSGTDITHASSSEATGQWQGGEMHLDGRSVDAEGNLILTRTRYTNITTDSFRMQQDRSTDNGQTWDEASLTVDAKRKTATATP